LKSPFYLTLISSLFCQQQKCVNVVLKQSMRETKPEVLNIESIQLSSYNLTNLRYQISTTIDNTISEFNNI